MRYMEYAVLLVVLVPRPLLALTLRAENWEWPEVEGAVLYYSGAPHTRVMTSVGGVANCP